MLHFSKTVEHIICVLLTMNLLTELRGAAHSERSVTYFRLGLMVQLIHKALETNFRLGLRAQLVHKDP